MTTPAAPPPSGEAAAARSRVSPSAPPSLGSRSDAAARRRWGAVMLGLGLLLFAVALTRVPWHPVPGGPLTLPAAETVLGAAQVARAEHVARWARVWSWSALALSLVCLVLLARSGRLRAWLARPWAPWPVRTLGGVALVLGVERLVTLPLAAAGQELRRRHGLSGQSWPGWLRDAGVGWLLSVVVSTVLIVALLALIRRARRTWPVWAGLGAAGLVLLGSFGYPLVVEPLFNRFTSLPDSPLRTAVLRLADHEGVRVGDVLVSDASRRTTTLNAYVSGFGDTRRVVLYDNLVEDLPQDQALSVVAHELAHAEHDDVFTGTLLGAAGAMMAVGALGLLWPRRRRATAGDEPGDGGHGVDGQVDDRQVDVAAASHGAAGGHVGHARGARGTLAEVLAGATPAVVPTLCAAAALGALAVAPVQNAISRQIETRADVDALRVGHDPAAFVAMQEELARKSLADPDPPAWSQWWFGSHPTLLQRVAIAQRVAQKTDQRMGGG